MLSDDVMSDMFTDIFTDMSDTLFLVVDAEMFGLFL